MQEFTWEVTDALLSEDIDVETVVSHYDDLPTTERDQMVTLMRDLRSTLVEVEPSPRYVYQLKQDLLGMPERDVIKRIRFMPARLHIAAMVAAVLAGLAALLFSRRGGSKQPAATRVPN